MATAPVETAYDPLRPPGAVMVQRDGLAVVGHYGSVSAEIAVCSKAAGLVDRSSVRQLAISGPEGLLDHVLAAAAPDGAPAPGRASCRYRPTPGDATQRLHDMRVADATAPIRMCNEPCDGSR